ncbi:MAG TPA: helix-turn-helix transcriptional regulator [Arenimonas sp.]|uniref:ArsR/SmtB family transcription factor n=1 Tax=Arenimonas sp. TaxID=1872635 RepID=UPI002D7FDDD8|nr:helix-turn-helix transcriptional regulator [Arenimonas sp.]HEU0153167.1 helix-turn-helix transcriptional regulator [Arenimonas sp.]
MLSPELVLAIRHESLLASDLVNGFSNPVRGQILMYVAQFTALTVGDLSSLTGTSISLMSLYVTQLQDAGWVCAETVGRARQVRLASEHRTQIVELIRHHSRHMK